MLPSVLEAEKRIMAAGKNKEYAGISGMKDFVDLSLKFAYGDDSKALQEKRITGVQVRFRSTCKQTVLFIHVLIDLCFLNLRVQTISGTGGVRLAGEFFSKFLGKDTPIYMPNPTWGNHIPIMKVRTFAMGLL